MFKRILKISGIVLLSFVMLIGVVVAFLAIRGDFKKKVIKPTDIKFTISKVDLVFDATCIDQENLDNEQIFSFTISALPLDVTERECIITVLEGSSLIQFKQYVNGKLEDYNSNKFYLNTPIYFQLKNVTEDNVEDYHDGVVYLKVQDKLDLLDDKLEIRIDRAITSISIFDRGIDNDKNNKIVNGLFTYEEGKHGGVVAQSLEAVMQEDYPLDIITAPLKSNKPFESVDAKLYEVYYMEDDQHKLLVNDGEVVKLQRRTDEGQIVEETCNFVKYDTENKRFVFNSAESGDFKFKLVTYPTYKIQDEINDLVNNGLSLVDKLKRDDIITKIVNIKVTGSDAERILFEGDNATIGMNLLQTNKWAVNNGTSVDMFDLGLTLAKSNSGTEITGRYNELEFLTDSHFSSNVYFTFKKSEIDPVTGEVTNSDLPIYVNLFKNKLGQNKASISGFNMVNIDNQAEYDVVLKPSSLTGSVAIYDLILSSIKYDEDGKEISTTTITFTLTADKDGVAGKTLTFATVVGYSDNHPNLTEIKISKKDTEEETDGNYYLNSIVDTRLILDDEIYEGDTPTGKYNFKSLNAGLYLAVLGDLDNSGKSNLVNGEFITSIERAGANSIITIKPIGEDLAGKELELYAIVVNKDGSVRSTLVPRKAVVNLNPTKIALSNNGELGLPVIVDADGLDFGEGVDVDDIVGIYQEGSYNEFLVFAPKYTLLTSDKAPKEWATGMPIYTYDAVEGYQLIQSSGKDYSEYKGKCYTKNNYSMIDCVSFVEKETIASEEHDVEYFLLGYIENGHFVNAIKATGINYYSKLYPVLIKSEYLPESDKLQTAEAYIDQLLTGKTEKAVDDGLINYDLTLLNGRIITRQGSAYINTGTNFSESKQYYIYEDGEYKLINNDNIQPEDINDLEAFKSKYYELVDVRLAKDFVGDISNANANLKYYTINDKGLLVEKK